MNISYLKPQDNMNAPRLVLWWVKKNKNFYSQRKKNLNIYKKYIYKKENSIYTYISYDMKCTRAEYIY